MSHKIENPIIQLKKQETKHEINVIEIQNINATLEKEVVSKISIDLEIQVRERTKELQDLNEKLVAEICERQAIEESLRDNQDALLFSEMKLKHYALELAETNKELKSFANIVAHDFRAPMVNMKGFSVELGYTLAELKDIINDDRAHIPEDHYNHLNELLETDVPTALNFINTSVDKLERMVAALLKMARLGRRDMSDKEVDMNETIKAVLLSFNHQIEQQGIHVVVGSLPKIKTDYLAMEQIISNLLDNAIKYLEPGRPGKIEIHCDDNDTEYLICIQDNGRGITPADYQKIFAIFRRVGNRDQPGEGMGLAYVKTLIRQLNGKVWCESELGVGTKFNFTLPKNQLYKIPHHVKQSQ